MGPQKVPNEKRKKASNDMEKQERKIQLKKKKDEATSRKKDLQKRLEAATVEMESSDSSPDAQRTMNELLKEKEEQEKILQDIEQEEGSIDTDMPDASEDDDEEPPQSSQAGEDHNASKGPAASSSEATGQQPLQSSQAEEDHNASRVPAASSSEATGQKPLQSSQAEEDHNASRVPAASSSEATGQKPLATADTPLPSVESGTPHEDEDSEYGRSLGSPDNSVTSDQKGETVGWLEYKGKLFINRYGPKNAGKYTLSREASTKGYKENPPSKDNIKKHSIAKDYKSGSYVFSGSDWRHIFGVAWLRGKLEEIDPKSKLNQNPELPKKNFPLTVNLIRWEIQGEFKYAWELRSDLQKTWKGDRSLNERIYYAALDQENRYKEFQHGHRQAFDRFPSRPLGDGNLGYGQSKLRQHMEPEDDHSHYRGFESTPSHTRKNPTRNGKGNYRQNNARGFTPSQDEDESTPYQQHRPSRTPSSSSNTADAMRAMLDVFNALNIKPNGKAVSNALGLLQSINSMGN